jgi:hypothetical protein
LFQADPGFGLLKALAFWKPKLEFKPGFKTGNEKIFYRKRISGGDGPIKVKKEDGGRVPS